MELMDLPRVGISLLTTNKGSMLDIYVLCSNGEVKEIPAEDPLLFNNWFGDCVNPAAFRKLAVKYGCAYSSSTYNKVVEDFENNYLSGLMKYDDWKSNPIKDIEYDRTLISYSRAGSKFSIYRNNELLNDQHITSSDNLNINMILGCKDYIFQYDETLAPTNTDAFGDLEIINKFNPEHTRIFLTEDGTYIGDSCDEKVWFVPLHMNSKLLFQYSTVLNYLGYNVVTQRVNDVDYVFHSFTDLYKSNPEKVTYSDLEKLTDLIYTDRISELEELLKELKEKGNG